MPCIGCAIDHCVTSCFSALSQLQLQSLANLEVSRISPGNMKHTRVTPELHALGTEVAGFACWLMCGLQSVLPFG